MFKDIISVLLIVVIIISFIPVMHFIQNKFDKRASKHIKQWKQNAMDKSKPLLIFYDANHGEIHHEDGTSDNFTANIFDVLPEMEENSCLIVVKNVIEYISDEDLIKLRKLLHSVSGGNYIILSREILSTDIFIDPRIIKVSNINVIRSSDKVSRIDISKYTHYIANFYDKLNHYINIDFKM